MPRPHGSRYHPSESDEELRRRIGDRRMVAWFYRSLIPYWVRVVIGLTSMLIGAAADMAPPLVMKSVVDDVMVKGQISKLPMLGLSLIGCFAASAVFSGLRMGVMHILAQRMVYDLRLNVHRHLQKLSLGYFESTSTGDIMSRLSNDVESVENMVAHGTDTIVSDSVRLLMMVGIMLYLSWKLAAIALIPLPVFVVAVIWFARRVRPYYRAVRDQLGEINAHLQENITGIRVVKAFAREEYEEELFDKASFEYYRAYRKGVMMWSSFFPTMGFLSSVSVVLIIWIGAPMVNDGQGGISVGTIVAFLGYIMNFYGPVRSLLRVHNTFNRALASLARIFEVMDLQPDITDVEHAIPLGRIEGEVRYEDVSFRYHTGEMVLRDVELVAEPGQTVAIVGRSGAGKTSIVNLVPRFYDPLAGVVKVDGVDIRQVQTASLRSQMALVLQDTFLFNDTVRENIRYGRLDALDEEVRQAAVDAYAHEFIIEDLPDGYETLIGERGVKLSGGQKQRLAIARALLADPRILILDEATSSVDTEAERIIQAAINRLVKGRTTFVIAHRLSTIVNADQIVVLEGGEIVERGTHKELMELAGLYKQMYEMQFEFPENNEEPPAAHVPPNGG